MQRNLQRIYNIAGRLATAYRQGEQLVNKLLYIHIFDHLFIVSFSKYHSIKRCRIILIFLPSFNRKYKKINKI